ncbi:PREDICTED: WAP four-disulfide core domain protein 12 [Chrysochloris asiatica]|uniref:WAP four-disulfide core domain protein 12 n=1 Tax=Chrysochloris asiatica TaxID=185453 RepID=A0A9B0TBP6_CHRAS|nr:PREDICTED: WAP four-disulfide core domain protein 12 [Chrysochloris asiatica]
MRPTSFWDFIGFLMFVTLVSGERIKKDKEKAGICPVDNRLCFIFDYPRCQRDNQCEGNKKCCFMECGFRCVIPKKQLKKGEEPLHPRYGALASTAVSTP